MNNFMNFDEKAAENAGIGNGLTESGELCGIMTNELVTAKSGAKGIEFSISGAQTVSYLTLYYQKSDGSTNEIGYNMIQAIMGICGIPNTTIGQARNSEGEIKYFVPELMNKPIGAVLQKEYYAKDDGTAGYKFNIVLVFNDRTRQTLKEMTERAQPTAVDRLLANLRDKNTIESVLGANAGGNGGGNYDYQQAQNNATAARPVSKFDQVNNQPMNNNEFAEDDLPY